MNDRAQVEQEIIRRQIAKQRRIRKPQARTLLKLKAIREMMETQSPRNPRDIYYRLRTVGIVPKGNRGVSQTQYAIKSAIDHGYVEADQISDTSDREVRQDFDCWENAEQIAGYLESLILEARVNFWRGQPRRLEVWCEKRGTVDRLTDVAFEFDVPVQPIGGYYGRAAVRDSARRLRSYGQPTTILYIGDLDPHGVRLEMDCRAKLSGCDLEWVRIAITPKLVDEHGLSGEPTTPRDDGKDEFVHEDFHELYPELGGELYEVESLDAPETRELVRAEIEAHVNFEERKRWQDCHEHRDETSRIESIRTALSTAGAQP